MGITHEKSGIKKKMMSACQHKEYFVRPKLVTLEGVDYLRDFRTYSEYNYLRWGIVSYLKTWSFEYALRMSREYFHNCNVIDFGCADGIFLPSLAKYFNSVVGIEIDHQRIEISSKLIEELKLNNAQVICNKDLALSEIAGKISGKEYHVLYLLETLEHIGDKACFYKSKIDFLKQLFTLINKKGIIILSVPNMIGLEFLIVEIGSKLTGRCREKISISNLIKAVFLKDTTGLEKDWNGGHLGFNHERLEIHLRDEFEIIKKKSLFFHILYVIKKRA